MSKPKSKVAFVWWPRRLTRSHTYGFDWVGWVWLQRAYLVYNVNHGWIAPLDYQTEEILNASTCLWCGQTLPHVGEKK